MATHGGAAATLSLSPQTFFVRPSGEVRRHRLEAISRRDLGVLLRAIFVGRWALGAFGIGAPNRRNDRLGACTSVGRCGTEKSDDDPHDEIAHLEAHIEELADKIESCRKFCSGTCSERATRVGRWKRARALAVCIPVSESRDQCTQRVLACHLRPLQVRVGIATGLVVVGDLRRLATYGAIRFATFLCPTAPVPRRRPVALPSRPSSQSSVRG